MALRPEMALGGGLASAALAVALYARALPPNADLRVVDSGDDDAESARKQALWTSVAVVAGVSLLAKDKTVFVTGGLVILALDWNARHAIWVNPLTGTAASPRRDEQVVPTQADNPGAYGPGTLAAVP
jgi:hypothetical protein